MKRGLDVAGVLAGFEQQDIRAAFHQRAWPARRSSRSSCGKVTPPVTVMALVVGPIEPATKRGLAVVENSSAACRARRAAARFSSWAGPPARTRPARARVAPKVLVSMMSAPAARYARWMSQTTSGRVRSRFSLQPSSAGPPKSSAVKCAPVAAWCPWLHRAPEYGFPGFPRAPAGAPPGGS